LLTHRQQQQRWRQLGGSTVAAAALSMAAEAADITYGRFQVTTAMCGFLVVCKK